MTPIRHTILFLISFAALISVHTVSGAGTGDPSAPYIYYYANTIDAIVVERADGTDSRVIAPGAMSADSSVIDNLDWSPSGEWMAWMAGGYNPYGGMVWFNGWIARSDGSQRLTLLDDVGYVIAMEWSPTDDLLFVAYRKAITSHLELDILIIDPNANRVIAHTEYQLEFWIESFPSGWLTDGSGIYYLFYFGSTEFLGQLNIDNTTLNRIFTSDLYRPPFLVNLFNGRLLSYEQHYDQQPNIQLVMRDLGTGRGVFLDGPPSRSIHPGFSVAWDPTMRYALIYYWQCPPDNYCYGSADTQVYLLDWEQGTLQFLAAHIIPGGEFEDQTYLFQPPSAIWSPDGRYAVLRDMLHHVMVVEAASGQVSPSIHVPDVMAWQWATQADGLVLLSSGSQFLYQYDVKQQRLSLLPAGVTQGRYGWFSVSPDNRFIGMMRADYDMVDLRTQTKRRWPHHSLGSNAGPIIAYVWDQSSRWYMTGEYTTFAGGGPGQSAVTIFNTAGTIRREISFCGYVGKCAGFVPDRALPHLGAGHPTSVIPEPELTLVHKGSVSGVAWSPDGSKIVSYSLGLQVWDVSATPELLTTYPAETGCYELEFSCRLEWTPDGRTISLKNDTIFETWDIESGNHTVTDFSKNPFCTMYHVISPDGLLLACVAKIGDNMHMSIVSTSTGLPVATIAYQSGPLRWSSDSTSLFLDNGLALWNVGEIPLHEAPTENHATVAPSASRYTFEARYYHRIYVWDRVTGHRLRDLNWYARGIALSPDGTRLAAVGSSLVTIWDVADLQTQGE